MAEHENHAASRVTIPSTEVESMNDQNNDYASEGEYRSSESNVSLGFTLLLVGVAIGSSSGVNFHLPSIRRT